MGYFLFTTPTWCLWGAGWWWWCWGCKSVGIQRRRVMLMMMMMMMMMSVDTVMKFLHVRDFLDLFMVKLFGFWFLAVNWCNNVRDFKVHQKRSVLVLFRFVFLVVIR